MTIQDQNIKIMQVPVSELNPAAYNPRKWDNAATDALTESIKRFGLVDPILVNSTPERKGTVIGGHFRLHVAKLLDYIEVPVVYIDIPDIEKEKELNLRLNKNVGEWDWELLKNFEADLLVDIGFTDTDLGNIWDESLTTEDDAFNEVEELKRGKETTIKPREMYLLGKHRLICGDSTNPEIVPRLMGTDRASVIYTDPPFNIGLDYNKGLGGRQNYGGTTDDKKSDADYREFLKSAIENGLAHAHPDLHVFSYCDQKYIGMVQQLFEEVGIKNQRVCLWIKNGLNLTPQIAFNKCYEPAVYGTIGKPYLSDVKNLNEIMNKEVAGGNQGIEDIETMIDLWLERRIAGQHYEHPTSKPPTLHEKPLKRCTKIGDIVLDLFGGSGSTLIACEQLKRRAYLVEKEPIFCQVIINRYERITGVRATKYEPVQS